MNVLSNPNLEIQVPQDEALIFDTEKTNLTFGKNNNTTKSQNLRQMNNLFKSHDLR